MNKFKNAILAILSTAWYAALTIFCTSAFIAAIIMFAENFLNGTIAEYVLLGIGLILLTAFVGIYVRDKAEKWNNRRM